MQSTVTQLVEQFSARHGCLPKIFRAPGRVNLIGEHTDYNDGFVLPVAIGFSTYVAVAPRSDGMIFAESLDFPGSFAFSLSQDLRSSRPSHEWQSYVRGVVSLLSDAGVQLSGANLLIHSEVPTGAGLSSSAALSVAVGYALAYGDGRPVDLELLAVVCQRAEHEFVGTQCGIMDQFAACFSRAGCAMLLDCRSLERKFFSVPKHSNQEDIVIAVCNSGVKHELATSAYNQRREECRQAVRTLSARDPNIKSLRDADLTALNACATTMDPIVHKRARHVIGENARVLASVEALTAGRLDLFGQRMIESHASLRDDYEVSCPELDCLVDAAIAVPGVFGARMTGGGFGGCTVNVLQADAYDRFVARVSDSFQGTFERTPQIFVCSPTSGVGRVETQHHGLAIA
jgi:galactokinase